MRRNKATVFLLIVTGLLFIGCAGRAQPTPAPIETLPPVVEFQVAPPATPTETPPGPLDGVALLEALQHGGYVIFFRHGATYRSQLDTDPQNLEKCATQRNLNEAGQTQSRAIGQAFAAANIPVGSVLASPYCRTRDTAQLAFGRVELSDDLINPFSKEDGAEVAALGEKLRRLLSKPPPSGMNTVLVGHTPNLQAATGLSIVEGEAAIFAPYGSGQSVLVGRVLPDDWMIWADSMAK